MSFGEEPGVSFQGQKFSVCVETIFYLRSAVSFWCLQAQEHFVTFGHDFLHGMLLFVDLHFYDTSSTNLSDVYYADCSLIFDVRSIALQGFRLMLSGQGMEKTSHSRILQKQ